MLPHDDEIEVRGPVDEPIGVGLIDEVPAVREADTRRRPVVGEVNHATALRRGMARAEGSL